jgi:hypothetical protein
MQATVRADNRPLTNLYDRAFTAINAPNVFSQFVARTQEPFQPSSRYPEGQPPVRYPDITTLPGFLENPLEDNRDILIVENRMMQKRAAQAPVLGGEYPYNWDAYGKIAFQKDRMGTLPPAEKAERIKYPYEPLRGYYPMEGWN